MFHLHGVCFVVGKVVSEPRFYGVFKHHNQAEQASEWRADWTEHTAALTAWAAWQHAWVRSHVWVWTWAQCYTECVPSAPPGAETLKDRACQCDVVVGALTFCCSSCNNRDAADCRGTRAGLRRAGWINASGQEKRGDGETRRGGEEETRALIWASRLCLSPVQGDSAFNSTAKLHRELIIPQIIQEFSTSVGYTLTHLLTHPQARQGD